MQRRSALKSLTMTLGGLATLPAWATNWTPESLGMFQTGSVDDQTLLGEIMETIIPETTTPGAKSLKLNLFAQRMITDCYGPQATTTLKQGLALTETTAQQTFGKAFADCDAAQRKEVLLKLVAASDPTGKPFVEMIRRLTIQGYTNSEQYLVNVQHYTMAPGYYHGCVPVTLVAADAK